MATPVLSSPFGGTTPSVVRLAQQLSTFSDALKSGAGTEIGTAGMGFGLEGNVSAEGALAMQTTNVEGILWVVIVDVIILTLTAIGAGAILVNMAYLELVRGRASTVRTRMVQGLVFTDFSLGIVALIPSADYIRRGLVSHQPGTNFCSGFGFLLVSVLWGEHLWTLLLAITTFMILIYPLHSFTRFLETKWYWSWLAVWVIAIAIAIVGHEVYGYYPAGGLCYYGNNSGLYGELIQFVPRGIVFVIIAILYARLYVFLKRPDKIKATFTSSNHISSSCSEDGPSTREIDDPSCASDQNNKQTTTSSSTARLRQSLARFSFSRRSRRAHSDTRILEQAVRAPQPDRRSTVAEFSPTDPDPSPPKHHQPIKSAPLAPWENIELPEFQIDGHRYGGSSASKGSGSIWGEWRGLRPKSRPSTPREDYKPAFTPLSSSNSSDPQSHRMTARMPSYSSAFDAMSPIREMSPVTVSQHPSPTPEFNDFRLDLSPASQPRHSDSPDPLEPLPHTATSAMVSMPLLSSSGSLTPASSLTSARPFTHHQFDPDIRRGSGQSSTDPGSHRGSHGPVTFAYPEIVEKREVVVDMLDAPGSGLSQNTGLDRPSENVEIEVQDVDADDDDEIDFARAIAESYPSDGTDPLERTTRSGSEDVVFVQESIASYLNRKTAMLMLYFPLAWLIFSQGLVDALIYGLVEWNVKRAVRRKVRRGPSVPRGSRGLASNTSWQRFNISQNIRSATGSRSNPIRTWTEKQTGSASREPRIPES